MSSAIIFMFLLLGLFMGIEGQESDGEMLPEDVTYW